MKIKSVSQNWFRQADSNLSVKLSVSMIDGMDNDSFYNIYETTTYDYLTLSITASVVFQYKTQAPYDKSYVARVSEEDLYQFNKGLQNFYRILSRPDLFTYYKSGKIDCNSKRDDITTISLKSGDFIEFEPGVVIDSNRNNQLPGVYLYINKRENKSEITIDEFEFLMYKFSRLDMGSDALQLINAKLLLEKTLETNRATNNGMGEKRPAQENRRQSPLLGGSIFSNRQKEMVIDNRPSDVKKINSLEDL